MTSPCARRPKAPLKARFAGAAKSLSDKRPSENVRGWPLRAWRTGIDGAVSPALAKRKAARSTTCHFYGPLDRRSPLAPYLCVMAGRSDEAQGWSETLQTRLRAKMDKLIDAFETSTDIAEKAQIEKDARTCGVFARSAKAIETMVPDPAAEKIRSAAPTSEEAANDDEASMHEGIPEDPEEIQAALAARFDRFAELLELKRRAELADGGDADAGAGGTAAPA